VVIRDKHLKKIELMNAILFIIIMTGLGFILGLSAGKVEDCIVEKDGKDAGTWLLGAFIAIIFISVMFSVSVGLSFEKKFDRIEERIENLTPTDTTHLFVMNYEEE